MRDPWLHVRVEPHGASAWTGAFELDAPGYYLTGVYGLPSGEDILVVAAGEGYVVSVRNPDVWHWAPLAPVVGVRRVDGSPLVVLWDFQDLAVYDAEGGLWRREELATDELEVTGASVTSSRAGSGGAGFRPEPVSPSESTRRLDACSRATSTDNFGHAPNSWIADSRVT